MSNEVTKEQAMMLMEAMCADAAQDFEGGVLAYVKADDEMKRTRNRLEKAVRDYMAASKRKYNALKVAIPEISFFKGKEAFSPSLDADYVLTGLIRIIFDGVDDEIFQMFQNVVSPEENIGGDADE